MANFSNLIRYFRACFQQDSRAVNLVSFFSQKVKDSHLLGDANLLLGRHVQVPVPTEWGQKVEKDLLVYGKERALYICAFFLSGQTTIAAKKLQVMAPMFLYPAELFKEGGVYYLQMDAEKSMLNPAFISCLKKEGTELANLYDVISDRMPKGFIDFDEIDQIEKILQEYFPDLDITPLAQYPEVLSEEKMKEKGKSKKDRFQILNGLGVGILQKQLSTRGILNELEQMAVQKSTSRPIEQLFLEKPLGVKAEEVSLKVPANLSGPQEDIFYAVAKYPLTMVVGPPGTGKSFTIAALAVDYLSRGKSVLIASKNNQAVDVVADKIEQELALPGLVVRAGRKGYKKQLQKKIKNLLFGIDVKKIGRDLVKASKREVIDTEYNLYQLSSMINGRAIWEMDRGYFLKANNGSWWGNFRKWWMKRRMEGEMPLWELLKTYQSELSHRHTAVRDLILLAFNKRLYDTLRSNRNAFVHLQRAITARTGNKKEQFFDGINFKKILGALPIWITNSADINQSLPLERHLFDLVIIDEASQCDIASCLPLLHRAMRAVVVGDPKQLRHISFLSRDQQRQLAQKFGVIGLEDNLRNYRDDSILDLVMNNVQDQEQICFLDEHFRSMPEIIDFSNRNFYNHALKVMTATPLTRAKKSVFLHSCNGKRYARGYNKVEAETIIEQIQEKINAERKLPAHLCQSIGILSPFREQVDYIQNQVTKHLNGEDLLRHKVLIGTPHAFQGEERDLMYISFAVDGLTHPSTFIYLNKEDVFNVSITRARSEQHVFWSGETNTLNAQSILAQYLSKIKEPPHQQHSDTSIQDRDDFLEEVKMEIVAMGVDEIYEAYPIAGVEMDLVVVHKGQTICIDLIGFPGVFEDAFPIERIRLLNRMGVSVFPLPYSAWAFKREECLLAFRKFSGILRGVGVSE